MSNAFNKFNQFVADIANKNVNLGSDTLKVMLTNTLPVATNSQYSDISAGEVANGNGYTTGGVSATLTSSTQAGGTYKLVLGQPVITATGAVGPFRYAVLYDSTPVTKTLIGWYDYGSSISLANTDTFTIAFDGTAGVLTIA